MVIALAFGLTLGSPALAATPPGGLAPPENPFSDKPREDKAEPTGGARKAETVSEASGDSDESAGEDEDRAQSSQEGDGEGDGEDEDSALHGLACLEGDATGGRRKGVQRRDFLKRHRFELAGLGGFYASDTLSSTYSYGGALAFYPSEDFGLELLVTRSPVRFRLEEPFTAFDQERHFQPGNAWQAIGSLLWSPIHAKFKFAESTIVHGDIFAVAGAGRTFHETVLGMTWEVGRRPQALLSRFVTFRLDLRDFLSRKRCSAAGATPTTSPSSRG